MDEAALGRDPAPPAAERADLAALREEVEDARDLEVAARDREQAVALTTEARDTYRSMPGSEKELALTEAWLREPGTGP